MIRSKLTKTFKATLFIVLSLLVFNDGLSASSSCKDRVFNIKVLDDISTNDLLTQLSLECGFSVVIKDDIA